MVNRTGGTGETSLWLATGLHGELGTQFQEILAATRRDPLEPVELGRAVRRADTLLHMAARTQNNRPFALFQSNVVYLHRVLRYAERCGVRRFVFFSTASVYRGSTKAVITEEDVAIHPRDLYAWTKRLGERMVARSRIPIRVIVRLPALLEVRNATNFVTRAYVLMRHAKLPRLWNLDHPFNGLMSAAELLRFIDVAEVSGTVNVAPEPVLTLREHLEVMAAHIGLRPTLLEEPSSRPPSVLCTRRLRETYGFTVQESGAMLREWMIRRDAG